MLRIASTVLVCFVVGQTMIGCHASQQPLEPRSEAQQQQQRTGTEPVSTTSTTSMSLVSASDEAITAITRARCEHELTCNKVGHDRPHENQSSCLEALGQNVNHEIGAPECPRGVVDAALVTCLADIRREVCGGSLEQGEKLPSCERQALCR